MQQATAREELAAIRALMSDSHHFVCGTWRHQMVWGILGSVGLVATWMALRNETYGLIGWIWAAVVGSGWTYSLALSRLGATLAPVRNVASRAFSGIWMAVGVSVTLLGALPRLCELASVGERAAALAAATGEAAALRTHGERLEETKQSVESICRAQPELQPLGYALEADLASLPEGDLPVLARTSAAHYRALGERTRALAHIVAQAGPTPEGART